jgi:predicted membrane-bound spermidine synthase
LTDRTISDRELAQALLREMSRHGGAHDKNSANASDAQAVLVNAELVLQRLQAHLLGWFGPDGLDALLVRALERARISHPILAGVQRPAPGTLGLANITAAVTGESGLDGKVDSSEVVEGIVALLAAILALIARLIGDDMMRHLVRQIWPTLPDDVSYASDSTNNNERSGK